MKQEYTTGWVPTTECPHCGTPRSASGTVRDGSLIYCRNRACHKWYRDRRFVPPPPSPPEPSPQRPADKPAPVAPIDRSAALPDDLIDLGFRLVFHDTSMVAVSSSFGCSLSSADLAEVLRSAREIASFCRYIASIPERDGLSLKQALKLPHCSHSRASMQKGRRFACISPHTRAVAPCHPTDPA